MDAPIEIVELQPRRALTVRRKMPQSGLGAFFMELFPRLRKAIVSQGATPSGPPFARYYNSDPAAFDTEAGLPFTGTVTAADGMRVTTLPGGRAAKTVHVGSYASMPTSRSMVWVRAKVRGSRTSMTRRPRRTTRCGPRCSGR